MADYSAADLARRAGVAPAYVGRLRELGILSPGPDGFSPSDVPRSRLVHSLDQAGVSVDGIAEAVSEGRVSLAFMDSPFYERFSALSPSSYREKSAETDVPVELLMVVREAIGFGQPEPDDRMREDELQIVPTIELLLRTGSRPAVVERLLRVWGESMRRVGEMEGQWWHTEMELPLLRSGMTEAEMMEATHRRGFELATSMEHALVQIYHAHHEHAATKNMTEDVERALAKAGVHSRLDRVPAICFLDITGYTRLSEERGDQAAADLAARLRRMVERTSGQHGGRPVKWLGDGVMLHFPDPGRGVAAALDMVGGVRDTELPPAHVGLHAGPVLFQEGDYFGRTVNIAARIADYARPGEVLVSREVVNATESAPVAYEAIGPVELKGIPTPIALYSARPTT